MPIPRKQFGQHFLCDKHIIEQILAALAPKAADHLVEIGPGQGALTLPLLEKVEHLDAIEIDRDLIFELMKRSNQDTKLDIHPADVLDFDFASLKHDERLLRVFGNLPYNISTPLIFHLLNFAPLISDMLFMLQKEVAERIAAKANTPHYGRLSIMVQYHCQVELLFHVPARAFYPPPQVQSSIIRLIPFRTYPNRAHDANFFAAIVRQAFNQRRKTLRNSLKDMIDDSMWAHIGIHSDLRPENLTVSDFVAISNALQEKKTEKN